MPYRLSALSRRRLLGVHPDLVRVVERAIELTEVDFRVQEGVRPLARQKRLVAAGASQTLASRHLTGHAVDLTALVGNEVRWDWPLYYAIAAAMRDASAELSVLLRWGGCWCALDRHDDPEQALIDYAARRRAQGKKPFLDGPHFELDRADYPA